MEKTLTVQTWTGRRTGGEETVPDEVTNEVPDEVRDPLTSKPEDVVSAGRLSAKLAC